MSNEEIMTRTLENIVAELGAAYDTWKGGEKEKNELKDEFFKLATQEAGNGPLAEKVVEIKARDDVQAKQIAIQRYPAWIPDDIREHPDREGYYEIIIRENPELMTFTFEHDGRVFQRQIVSGSPILDDERLQAEDPELWERITYVPEPERKLRDFDDLDPETLGALSEYLHESKPTIKFPAPKRAKSG